MLETSEHSGAVMAVNFTFNPEDSEDPCIYCSRTNFDHSDHCPFRSGFWPISGPEGDSAVQFYYCESCCEEHTTQFICPRCDRFFEDEDHYRFVHEKTGLLVVYVEAPENGLAVCLDCAEAQAAALRELLNAR